MTYATGSIYSGMFFKSEYCGKGRFSTVDGCSYDGHFIGNMFNGHGTMTYPNGNSYEGEWLNDLKHGSGRMTYADGRPDLIGQWVRGSFNSSRVELTLPKNCPKKAAKFFGEEYLNPYDKKSALVNVTPNEKFMQAATAWREASSPSTNSVEYEYGDEDEKSMNECTEMRGRSRTNSYGRGLFTDELVRPFLPKSPNLFDSASKSDSNNNNIINDDTPKSINEDTKKSFNNNKSVSSQQIECRGINADMKYMKNITSSTSTSCVDDFKRGTHSHSPSGGHCSPHPFETA